MNLRCVQWRIQNVELGGGGRGVAGGECGRGGGPLPLQVGGIGTLYAPPLGSPRALQVPHY